MLAASMTGKLLLLPGENQGKCATCGLPYQVGMLHSPQTTGVKKWRSYSTFIRSFVHTLRTQGKAKDHRALWIFDNFKAQCINRILKITI